MYSEIKHKERVYLITLGCPKNEVDSQVWLSHLFDSGFEIVDNPDRADFLFVNTCAFIKDARLESKEYIDRLLALKEADKSKKLYIVGCWAQLEGEKLLNMFPPIDGVLGNLSISNAFRTFFENRYSDEKLVHIPQEISGWYPFKNILPDTFPYAYLKIAEGCNNNCSYCALPNIRGGFRSMPSDVLVEQARHLVQHGFREIILVAQETTRYGFDLPEKHTLTSLLQRLNDIEGEFIIRIMYTNPLRVKRRLVEAIRDLPKVVKYLDIPLQHYNDEILNMMGRKYTSGDIERLLEMIHNVDDEIVLRTTFIVGFPGEGDDKFEELLKFVERGDFLHIGVFQYSEEHGTEATQLPGKVPQQVSALRKEIIEMTHSDILSRKNEQYVGKVVDALIDGEAIRDGFFTARMVQDAPQIDRHIKVKGAFKIGQWSRIHIVKALSNSFLGVEEKVWREL